MEGCAKKCNGNGVRVLGILGLLCDDVHGGRRYGRQELSRVLTLLPCPALAPGLQQQPELPLLPGLGPTLLQHAGPVSTVVLIFIDERTRGTEWEEWPRLVAWCGAQLSCSSPASVPSVEEPVPAYREIKTDHRLLNNPFYLGVSGSNYAFSVT